MSKNTLTTTSANSNYHERVMTKKVMIIICLKKRPKRIS